MAFEKIVVANPVVEMDGENPHLPSPSPPLPIGTRS
jgi:hypothetical protein